MNTLTVDIGNSRTKYEVWTGNDCLDQKVDLSHDEIISLIIEFDIKGVIVSSVKQDPSALLKFVSDNAGVVAVDFSQSEISKYAGLMRYKGNVGPDRIAAFLGSKSIFCNKPVLIVDAGTALTLDISDNEGRFCGGNISLGLQSRVKCLANAALRLPDIGQMDKYVSFGYDTLTSIQSGAINGVMGEIIFAASRAVTEYGIEKILITGGDGARIKDLLNERLDLYFDPYLVGRGLNRHLREFYLHLD